MFDDRFDVHFTFALPNKHDGDARDAPKPSAASSKHLSIPSQQGLSPIVGSPHEEGQRVREKE